MSAALDLILQELTNARAKHPTFAQSDDYTVTVLVSEMGEYSSALLRGAIREAAQIGAVAIRIIEYWLSGSAARTCGTCGHEPEGFICDAGHDTEGGRCGCLDWTPKTKEAPRG